MPDAPVNGHVTINGRQPGDHAVYSCDTGFRLDGPDIRFCSLLTDPDTELQRHGWSDVIPVCEGERQGHLHL